jgi:hypothetical protein
MCADQDIRAVVQAAGMWRRPCTSGHCPELSTDVPGLAPGDVAVRNSARPGHVVVFSRADLAGLRDALNGGCADLCEEAS